MKKNKERSRQSYFFGIMLSAAVHFFTALVMILVVQYKSSGAIKRSEVFSVTLEGGQALGGVDLAPLDPDAKQKVVPNFKNIQSGIETPHSEIEDPKVSATPKKLTAPSVVDDPEYFKKQEAERLLKIEVEKKKLAEAEKKRLEELERQKAEERRKQEAEKQKLDEEARKKAEAEKQKQLEEEQARKQKEEIAKKQEEDFNNKLNNAKQAAIERFSGESVNAGGEGIGAARLGGEGTGGGILVSVEKRRYDILLEAHVHQGWRWLAGRELLQASVEVRMQPGGVISSAEVVASSSNRNFDEAVLRAVYKASPLPPPPESLYDQYYRVVTFIFKSNE